MAITSRELVTDADWSTETAGPVSAEEQERLDVAEREMARVFAKHQHTPADAGDDLPTEPQLPVAPGDHLAILIPTKGA